jgi:hypothetical protein
MELIIYQEERLFRDSLAAAVGLEKPVDLTEDATPQQEEMYEEAMANYDQQVKQISAS